MTDKQRDFSEDNGLTASDPKTGNTKGHISSKAGIKRPEE